MLIITGKIGHTWLIHSVILQYTPYIFWYHHLWNPHILATFHHLHRGVAAAVEDLTGVKLLDGHRGRPVARLTPNFPKNLSRKSHSNSYVTCFICFYGGYLPLTSINYELIKSYKHVQNMSLLCWVEDFLFPEACSSNVCGNPLHPTYKFQAQKPRRGDKNSAVTWFSFVKTWKR